MMVSTRVLCSHLSVTHGMYECDTFPATIQRLVLRGRKPAGMSGGWAMTVSRSRRQPHVVMPQWSLRAQGFVPRVASFEPKGLSCGMDAYN